MNRQPVRHLVAATLTIFGVSLLTLLIEHWGLLDRFEMTGLDAFNIAQAPADSSDIVIVGITDLDYLKLFNETSPLDCVRVREDFLEAVASGGPSVIGVDLDTSSPAFACLAGLQVRPPVIWAADAIWHKDHETFTEIPVLAGHPREPDHVQDSHGIALLPQDTDGVIRRYRREFPLEGGGTRPSFSWAVVRAACARGCEQCCDAATERVSESLRLNFAGDRFAFPPLSVQDVLDAAATAGPKVGAGNGGGSRDSVWATQGLLTGKIVLLGGDYRAARDRYVTPIGELSGLQINAQAIESELHGGGIRELNHQLEFAFDISIGYALVLINYKLRSRLGVALLVSLLCVPVLCLAASYFAFSAFALWFNFVPVVVSVLIDELYHRAREYQDLARAHHRPA